MKPKQSAFKSLPYVPVPHVKPSAVHVPPPIEEPVMKDEPVTRSPSSPESMDIGEVK